MAPVSVLSKLHEQRIRRLPCVMCWWLSDGKVLTPMQEIHHLEHDRHPFSVFLCIPLCWEHHNGYLGIHGKHRLGFEKFHKVTQVQLLGVTTMLLLADRAAVVGQ